jgi:hypothetical protein
LKNFNSVLRNSVLNRVGEIRTDVNKMYDESIEVWSRREAYNANVKKKNESLKFLLDKSSECIQEIKNREEGVDDKKKGGKGKPAPKKK